MVKLSLVEHEYISIIIYIFRSYNYLLMSTFCGYDSVVIPSPPLILTPQTTSTSITLSWNQTIGDEWIPILYHTPSLLLDVMVILVVLVIIILWE